MICEFAANPVPVTVTVIVFLPADVFGVMLTLGTTLYEAVALFVPSEAETVVEPAGEDGTVNEAENEPLALLSTDTGLVVCGTPLKSTEIGAEAKKPVPVTVSVVAVEPFTGDRVILEIKLKFAVAEFAEESVAVTRSVPAEITGASKVAVKFPTLSVVARATCPDVPKVTVT